MSDKATPEMVAVRDAIFATVRIHSDPTATDEEKQAVMDAFTEALAAMEVPRD